MEACPQFVECRALEGLGRLLNLYDAPLQEFPLQLQHASKGSLINSALHPGWVPASGGTKLCEKQRSRTHLQAGRGPLLRPHLQTPTRVPLPPVCSQDT